LPPFHEEEATYCPSKSRKIVAFAEGKLLNAGVQKASVENKTVKTIKIVKNFFIA